MSRITHFLITFLTAIATVSTAKNAEASHFQAGVEAYEQGEYATAKAEFLDALEINKSAAAHHNLGLTELKLDNPAQAIWQLEHARLLDPFNDDYREKLNLVREQIGLPISTQKWHLSFSRIISIKVWTIVATISFWLLFAAIVLPRAAGKKVTGRIKILCLLNLIVFSLSATAIWLNLKDLKSGIVLSQETIALNAAPSTAAPESGFARPGERARVIDQHNDFYKVITEGSATGWISGDDFRLLVN